MKGSVSVSKEWTIKTLFWYFESDGTDEVLGCNSKEHEGGMCGNWNYEIPTAKWGDQTTSINEAVFYGMGSHKWWCTLIKVNIHWFWLK